MAFVGTIEDFPIAELSAAAETERASGHTTEGEGDHSELASGKGAGISRTVGGSGRSFGLGGGEWPLRRRRRLLGMCDVRVASEFSV